MSSKLITTIFLFLILSTFILAQDNKKSINESNYRELNQLEAEGPVSSCIKIDNWDIYSSLSNLTNYNPSATESITLSGRIINVKNTSQPLFGQTILTFLMRDPVQYSPSLLELIGTIGFNISLPPNPIEGTPGGEFSIKINVPSIEEKIQNYPYIAFTVFPGSNVSILDLRNYYTAQTEDNLELNLGEVLAYSFDDLGVLAISGITHINGSIPKDKFRFRPNLPENETNYCAPFTYQVLEHGTQKLLLDVPVVFINAFATIVPLEDFFFWLPINKTIDVRFVFYSTEVGWVDEIWTFNTTYATGLPFSYHLLTLDVAKQTVKIAEDKFKEIKSKGVNLDYYEPSLDIARNHQVRSLDYWNQATPNITFSGSLQFFDLGEMGFNALLEAEFAIIKAQRAEKLAQLYYDSLAAQSPGISALTTFILATLISLLVAQAITDNKLFSLTIRTIMFFIMWLAAFIANPLLSLYLETENINIIDINLPIIAIIIGLFILITMISLLIPIPRFLDRSYTFLTLSIRNLRRRKSRSLVMFLTLGIAITSFVLIVSNNYEVDVITEGKKVDYEFDESILIENYISIPFQGSYQLPLTKRVEIISNVTIQVYEETEIPIAMRFYSTIFDDIPDITIDSHENNWSQSLGNLLAISPLEEEKITHLESRYKEEGSWLKDNTSNVLISKALQRKYDISLNETISFTYNASGTVLGLSLNVTGIFNDQLGDLSNVNGKPIAPPNYIEERPCNSTEFIVLDFAFWRVQLAKTLAETSFIQVSETPPTQILLGTTNIEVAKELADRLENQKIVMGKNNQVYEIKISFFGKTEGVIPQIIPLAISALIVYQVILNSVWERRREIRLYGTLGLSDRGVKVLLSTEYIILGIICGGIAYYVGLVLFPIVKAANIESTFLSQKTDVTFAVLSIAIAVTICALAAIPAITKAYNEIIPHEKIVVDFDDSFELPARFNESDRAAIDAGLTKLQNFKDSSFNTERIAIGNNGTKITLKTSDGVIRAYMTPGSMSKKQINQLSKEWIKLALKTR